MCAAHVAFKVPALPSPIEMSGSHYQTAPVNMSTQFLVLQGQNGALSQTELTHNAKLVYTIVTRIRISPAARDTAFGLELVY